VNKRLAGRTIKDRGRQGVPATSPAETAQGRVRFLDEAEPPVSPPRYRGVSFRELGRAVGVRPFTIQHHFGSKLGLYSTV